MCQGLLGRKCSLLGVVFDQVVGLAGEVAFEAAHDFGFGAAFGGASCDVVAGALVVVDAVDQGDVQGAVGLAVSAAVEAVALDCRASDFVAQGKVEP